MDNSLKIATQKRRALIRSLKAILSSVPFNSWIVLLVDIDDASCESLLETEISLFVARDQFRGHISVVTIAGRNTRYDMYLNLYLTDEEVSSLCGILGDVYYKKRDQTSFE